MRQFSWSTTAHRRFGSWNKFLRRAGIIHQLDSSEVNEMIRERNLLWREILFFTSESEWYLDQKKIEKIERLRKAMDIIDQELNECSISREERERAK